MFVSGCIRAAFIMNSELMGITAAEHRYYLLVDVKLLIFLIRRLFFLFFFTLNINISCPFD